MENRTKEIARERSAHRWSDTLATWGLCEKAACQRAHVCRGDGEACLKAKFPRLPERVRETFGTDALPRSINMITGPSRSADIAQILILGAHGPRRLHVLIV